MRIWPGFGAGLGVGLILLGLVNAALFNDWIVQRYGAVFAVGRAMDKQLFAEKTCPQILILGNSRVDNGIDPRAMQTEWGTSRATFNLGVPGTNARIGYGMLTRLEETGCLAEGKIQLVVIGLDESYLQNDDSLGYSTFFADSQALLDEGAVKTWLGTWLKLWAYTDNLRQLREPDKALRFVEATIKPLEPVGGAAWRHLGYRAGFGATNQNEAQAQQQEEGADIPPTPVVQDYLFKITKILQQHNISVAVSFPPLLNRSSAYADPVRANGAYFPLSARLKENGVYVISQPDPVPRQRAYFFNAGHLSDKGAQIYSRWLAKELEAKWHWLSVEGQPK